MEYGISTYWFVDERLTSRKLDQLLNTGFHCIELFAARQHFDYTDPNHVRDIASWFDDHGIMLHSLHAPLFPDANWGRTGGLPIAVTYPDKRRRIESMDEIRRAIDAAEQLPFRYLVVHMGLPEEDYSMEKLDAALTCLEHINLFAKDRGAQLVLENVPNELCTAARLLQFLEYTRLDLKFCFDVGHANLGEGVQKAFSGLKSLIVTTHVHDNLCEKDDHLMPFDGQINWEATMQDFCSVDGQFPVLFEIRNAGQDGKPLGHLRQVIRKLEAIR
jgi:sugar phosphate isomerase/epimerase